MVLDVVSWKVVMADCVVLVDSTIVGDDDITVDVFTPENTSVNTYPTLKCKLNIVNAYTMYIHTTISLYICLYRVTM